jgi:RNA polymerase sigma factor (sigma-70 family)
MSDRIPLVLPAEDEKLALIRRCVVGDEDAWRTFYERYRDALPDYLLDFRLPRDWIDQIVHDFLVHLFLRRCGVLDRYQTIEGVRFESWLRIVFRRFALRWMKTTPLPRWDPSQDPFEIIERDQPRACGDPHVMLGILKILSQLTDRDGRLVSLLLEGWPYAEIGRRLDMKEPTVAVAVQRLRGRVRELLSRQVLESTPSKVFPDRKGPSPDEE